jgi:ribosomal subunit interface protein
VSKRRARRSEQAPCAARFLLDQGMEITPEIIFHDVERSDWVEAYVAERLAHLERFARGITRCRVTLTREQASQRTGNRYSALVEVRVPPQHDLAVKKQKEIVDMPTQMPALINLAFGAIERQLKKTAQLRRGEEKAHEGEPGEEGPQASSIQVVGKSPAL